jgi:ubiquinone/menaquinone biosynthesis C-methylase UbiE
MVAVPPRLAWAMATMQIEPDDHVLEIGCGSGTAASLVCQRLAEGDGHLTALDRSATVLGSAEFRNIDSVRAGRATFLPIPLNAVKVPAHSFNTVFAINVNLFWVRSAVTELDLVRRALRRRGKLFLFNEPPDPRRAQVVGERVAAFLTGHGMVTTTLSARTRPDREMVCVVAQEPARVRRSR